MYPQRQKFFVLGLSRSGRAATEFLLSRGATVYIYDDVTGERVERTSEELVSLGAKRIGKENLDKTADFCDVLVLSPGIPIDHPTAVLFKRKGKAVVGETELAARFLRCPVIAVTGTNGKTTTVSMLSEVLCKGGFAAKACGTIGTPMIEFCGVEKNAIAVAEISSFQMETLNSLCPHIAVVLNVTEDHLNRHYNMENYVFLKAKLLKNCSEAEYAVLNYDDLTVRGFSEKTKARIVWFSVRERVRGAYYENGSLYYMDEKILSADLLHTEGLHNIQNALAVIATAKLMGVATEIIAAALTEFKGINHRIRLVGSVDGVDYIDDSKGTNVDATVKAVGCMKKPTILLLGGKNKGYDYMKLFSEVKKSKVVHAVLYGENRFELFKAARACDFEAFTVCEKFAFAVQIAALLATEGQAVLFSPASASFDEFVSYEERGEKFVEIVTSFGKIAREEEEDKEERGDKEEPVQSERINTDAERIDDVETVERFEETE